MQSSFLFDANAAAIASMCEGKYRRITLAENYELHIVAQSVNFLSNDTDLLSLRYLATKIEEELVHSLS